MAATGGSAQRISFGDGIYSTPVWSPRGDYIAFTTQAGGKFAIGVMKPDGTGERVLTEGFHNEGPTFAPNGRVIMFFRDPGGNAGPSLFTIDIAGRNELARSDAELCLRSGLVAAVVVGVPTCAVPPYGCRIQALLTIAKALRGDRSDWRLLCKAASRLTERSLNQGAARSLQGPTMSGNDGTMEAPE